MAQFYTDPSGHIFTLKEIFSNYQELMTDLAKAWTSPISVGEYVLISYGDRKARDGQAQSDYESNYSIDRLAGYNEGYNGRLYQKIYDATTTANEGLKYKELVNYTGSTPDIAIDSVIVDADDPTAPELLWNHDNPDYPVGRFRLPAAERLVDASIELDDANAPDVELSALADDGSGLKRDRSIKFILPKTRSFREGQMDVTLIPVTSTDNPSVSIVSDGSDTTYNYFKLSFSLPKKFESTVPVTPISRALNPSATVVDDGDNMQLRLSLPQIEAWTARIVEWLNVGTTPQVDVDSSDLDNLVLRFKLPKQQEIKVTQNVVLAAPTGNASVDVASAQKTGEPGIQIDTLTFTVPRAGKFAIGNELAGYDATQTATISGIEPGDRYINDDTGRVYYAASKDDTTGEITFTYEACLLAPLPTVSASPVNPYAIDASTGVATPVGASLDVSYKPDNDHRESWDAFAFKLPKAPMIGLGTQEFVEPNIPGNISTTYSETGVAFNFKIPKGEVGDALHIVKNYDLTKAQVATDDLALVAAYIEADLHKKPDDEDIIAVTYDDGTDKQSYWYYCDTNRNWGRALLTGGVGSLLQKNYTPTENDDNKAYSVTVINGLIGGTIADTDKAHKAYSAAQVDQLLSDLTTAFDAKITTLNNKINDLETEIDNLKQALVKDIKEQQSWGSIADDLKAVDTTGYTLLATEPADWATNFTDYFTLSRGEMIAVTGSKAPTFTTDKYYSKD